jgi:hypothetical protein
VQEVLQEIAAASGWVRMCVASGWVTVRGRGGETLIWSQRQGTEQRFGARRWKQQEGGERCSGVGGKRVEQLQRNWKHTQNLAAIRYSEALRLKKTQNLAAIRYCEALKLKRDANILQQSGLWGH